MRDPELLHKAYELELPNGVINIDSVPEYCIYDYDLNDDKSFNKFIKDIERDVRNSFEYKQMVKFLRDYVDMNQCAFFKNVNNIDSTKVRIEIHHEPLSLSDITHIVVNKRMDLRESLEVEDISKEIMYLHYNMIVGLIPLSQVVHLLVHNKYLFIPTSAIFGKYREFINRYSKWILPEQMEIIEKIEDYTKTYDENEYKDILSRHYIYVDMEEQQDKSNKELINIIKEHIANITNS